MAPEAKSKPKGRPLGLKTIATVFVGLLVAAAAFYSIGMRHVAPKPKPVIVDLGTYVTNLDDPTIQHYIKVTVSVEVASSAQAKLLGQDMTVVESNILAGLKGVTVEEAAGPGAFGTLGRVVRRAVAAAAPGVDVMKVYFTQFLVE